MRKIFLLILLSLFLATSVKAEGGWQGTFMDDLTDVDSNYDDRADDDILYWNNTLKTWVSGSLSSIVNLSVYYKLDGTNANGYLYLDSNKYLKKIDANTVGLYVNDVLMQDWSSIAGAPPVGSYMGFGCLLY